MPPTPGYRFPVYESYILGLEVWVLLQCLPSVLEAHIKLDLVSPACNCSTQEAEAGRSEVQGYSDLNLFFEGSAVAQVCKNNYKKCFVLFGLTWDRIFFLNNLGRN